MRLIDADELKKKAKMIDWLCNKQVVSVEDIDNAPTVKTYCYFCGQTEHGQIEERPQGEWIEKHSDYGVYYQCSICHKMPPNYECDYKEGAIKTNFCPNCGADMRGNKNETDN